MRTDEDVDEAAPKVTFRGKSKLPLVEKRSVDGYDGNRYVKES